MIDAIVPVWKPVDWTSFSVVRKIKAHVKPSKVGHAGTLDPFAEGILIICIGKMTSRVESMMDLKKEYLATVQLGETTDTLDPTGTVIETAAVGSLDKSFLELKLKEFTGRIEQVPPMYSALKRNGVPLYKLARKGKVVDRKPRSVDVYSIDLLSVLESSFKIRVTCGRGTYIRALAADIARSLGTVGYLTELTRTAVGEYNRENAITVEEFPQWLSSAA